MEEARLSVEGGALSQIAKRCSRRRSRHVNAMHTESMTVGKRSIPYPRDDLKIAIPCRGGPSSGLDQALVKLVAEALLVQHQDRQAELGAPGRCGRSVKAEAFTKTVDC